MISMHEAGVIECLGVDRFVHSLLDATLGLAETWSWIVEAVRPAF